MQNSIRQIARIVSVWVMVIQATLCFAQIETSPNRLANLRSAIEVVLKETQTPALGIAIVDRNGPIWIAGMGKASIEEDLPADESTLFRIASISKMFVALSILKLQEEGKLTLNDKVRDLVPEIQFFNPWETTEPVRVVHLLEHTTGWDDLHLTEQVQSPITLREALDLHPHSRRSRWIPGSRMAYSNSGSGVAGYIVEKVSGYPYETFVYENFFRPLQMLNTTFFNDDTYTRLGATLYDVDLRPLPYRHVIQRPAGAIHSSPADMARFLVFLLDRGMIDSTQVISRKSVERMEVSKTTPGAKAGLELGFGLANFTSVHNGFVYQGHNGGMPGALSELAYLPEQGVGHVILINRRSGQAFARISEIVRDFETRQMNRVMPGDSLAIHNFQFVDGYYRSINPRMQGGYFFDRIFDIYSFRREQDRLVQRWLLPGSGNVYYPASDSTFLAANTRRVGLVSATDPLEGKVLYTDARVLKPVSSFVVFGQLAILIMWLIAMAVGTLVGFVAFLRRRRGKRGGVMRLTRTAVLGSFIFFATAGLLVYAQRNHNELLAAPRALSLAIMAMSVWYVLCVVSSLVRIFTSRIERAERYIFWTMTVLTALHLVVTIYLLWYDVLPVITWS